MSNVPGITGKDLLRWNVLAYKRNKDLSPAEQREWNHLVRLHDGAVKAARAVSAAPVASPEPTEQLFSGTNTRKAVSAAPVASPEPAGTPILTHLVQRKLNEPPVLEVDAAAMSKASLSRMHSRQLEYSRRHAVVWH